MFPKDLKLQEKVTSKTCHTKSHLRILFLVKTLKSLFVANRFNSQIAITCKRLKGKVLFTSPERKALGNNSSFSSTSIRASANLCQVSFIYGSNIAAPYFLSPLYYLTVAALFIFSRRFFSTPLYISFAN